VAALTTSRRRERRFLALVEAGATVAEACRAVGVSRTTIYRRARDVSEFAHRLDLARAPVAGPPDGALGDPLDWREIASRLEAESPERWALPGDQFDSRA
jgi:hypothetical protein